MNNVITKNDTYKTTDGSNGGVCFQHNGKVQHQAAIEDGQAALFADLSLSLGTCRKGNPPPGRAYILL